MKNPFPFIFFIILLVAISSCNQSDPEMRKNYKVYNRSISRGTEAGSVHLNDKISDGLAWINGRKFKYGTIEFDAKGKDDYLASFVGIAFHGVNDTTYEVIYFRPFNFQASDPERKNHAVQYIALPKFDWPVLRSDHPGMYEQPISPAPKPNNWFHVRIIVESENIRVYVNGNSSPALSVTPLVHTEGELIGYWVGGTSAGDWKNFKIVPATASL
ncbi:hypothetical protein [Mucilaginibacter sp. BT774]|uniref:hypothetical protein n=1 Tax=Mucilaginibacter sp. BT774 TaxID=3062276 RepID=UPI002674CDD5|nr:hypothetical protein [Mucilaginibacter sp. BT774]MDO3628785.1 hypothetical protein [Mucilaginibacter sp. BT774]